jgi:hypothetical protein
VYESFCENRELINVKQKADSIRPWAKFFSPTNNMKGFKIPKVWRDFLTVILLNPSRFEWARSFVVSKAWQYILQDRDSEGMVTFSIPNNCRVDKELLCSNIQDGELQHLGGNVTPEKEVPNKLNSLSTTTLHLKRPS